MNTYFRFKQFTVHQEKCAMKVCTDSCLFGAFIANSLQHPTSNLQPPTSSLQHILDIGTGTGLLSLMLAQKTDAGIDAIEIDKDACIQAKENFENSEWKNRLDIFHTDAVHFKTEKKYGLIISNPPFFEDDLRSDQQNKNNAKHDTALTLKTLIDVAVRHLHEDGIFAVLLPFHRTDYFISIATDAGYHLNKKLSIRQTDQHNFFRSALVFSKTATQPAEEEISIKIQDSYSNEFSALLKDYYLHL